MCNVYLQLMKIAYYGKNTAGWIGDPLPVVFNGVAASYDAGEPVSGQRASPQSQDLVYHLGMAPQLQGGGHCTAAGLQTEDLA